MSHKSGHIIISRINTGASVDVIRTANIELQFPEGTTLEEKLKKVRQVERLLDKLYHDDED